MLVIANLANFLEVFNGGSLHCIEIINALYITGIVYTDEDTSQNIKNVEVLF